MCEFLYSQEPIRTVRGYALPEDLFSFYVGDIDGAAGMGTEWLLSAVTWTPADEVSGEVLDRSSVYWKYIRLPNRRELVEEEEEDDATMISSALIHLLSFRYAIG